MRKKRVLMAVTLCLSTVLMSTATAFAGESSNGESKEKTQRYSLEENIPDVIRDEIGLKEQNGKRVTEDEKNLNTIVYENKSGTKTMYLFEKSVKYVDDGNEFKRRILSAYVCYKHSILCTGSKTV